MRRMKKILTATLVLVLVIGMLIPTGLCASEISVTVDGVAVDFEGQPPIIVDGRTLVPVRGVFEALGFDIGWNQDTQTATLISANHEVVITVSSVAFTTNGISHALDVPAQIIGGRTMLPIRAVVESVGYHVNWDGTTNTVFINSHLSINDLYHFGGHVWRVLDVQGDRALLLSEYVIGRMRQGPRHYALDTTPYGLWEASYIRYHLNNQFFYSTFTPAEQVRVAQTRVVNSDNPWSGTLGGSDTYDRIFLLSLDELVRYFGDSGQLANQSYQSNEEGGFHDQYNQSRIAMTLPEGLPGWYDYQGGIAFRWWLRSPGCDLSRVFAGVNADGSVGVNCIWAGDAMWDAGSWLGNGIRPALWISLQ